MKINAAQSSVAIFMYPEKLGSRTYDAKTKPWDPKNGQVTKINRKTQSKTGIKR